MVNVRRCSTFFGFAENCLGPCLCDRLVHRAMQLAIGRHDMAGFEIQRPAFEIGDAARVPPSPLKQPQGFGTLEMTKSAPYTAQLRSEPEQGPVLCATKRWGAISHDRQVHKHWRSAARPGSFI